MKLDHNELYAMRHMKQHDGATLAHMAKAGIDSGTIFSLRSKRLVVKHGDTYSCTVIGLEYLRNA